LANLTVRRVDAAAVADALQGSDLERMPGPGMLYGWMASTVNTATFNVTGGRENIARAQAVLLRANGMPLISDDPPSIQIPCAGDERFIIATGGTTGTLGQVYTFVPAEDL